MKFEFQRKVGVRNDPEGYTGVSSIGGGFSVPLKFQTAGSGRRLS